MKLPYELFVFDLDGTLLQGDGSIAPETAAFLEKIKKEARVTLATGRSLPSARPYIEKLGITIPVILYHGAVVWDPTVKSVIRERRVPPKLARRALAAVTGYPVHPQVYHTVTDPTIYVARVTPPIRTFAEREGLHLREVDDLAETFAQPPLKLLFIGDPEVLLAVEAVLRENVPELTVVRSEGHFVEALPPGVSKGEAMAWLCQKLGVPLDRVVAAGDQESDLTMIEQAGLGVAMAHAPEVLRARADLVIPTLSVLLRHLSLEPL